MRRVFAVLVITTGGLLLADPAAAAGRPDRERARTAVELVADDMAVVFDGDARIGRLLPRGRKSYVCDVRIVGPEPLRLKFVATGHEDGVLVSARLRD